MRLRRPLTLLPFLIPTTLAAALPDKPSLPAISPPFPFNAMETTMRSSLPPTASTSRPWPSGWIPQACKDLALSKNLNPSDFEVFGVLYADCPSAWNFCRHKLAQASKEQMIDVFGRLPVRMRSYVRSLTAIPDLKDGIGSLWYYPGDIEVHGTAMDLHTMAHEIGHGLDYLGAPAVKRTSAPYSNTEGWRGQYAKDTASPSDYARTNWQEDWAEAAIIATYDKSVKGGLATAHPGMKRVEGQLRGFQDAVGDAVTPGGSCRVRLQNSPPVQIAGKKARRTRYGARGSEAKPDVAIKGVDVMRIDEKLVGLSLSNPVARPA